MKFNRSCTWGRAILHISIYWGQPICKACCQREEPEGPGNHSSWTWAGNMPVSCTALDKAGWGRRSFPSTQHWKDHNWRAVSSSGLFRTGRAWAYWRKSIKRLQRWRKDCRISPTSNDSELELYILEKRRISGILLMYTNTWRESTKKIKNRALFWSAQRQDQRKGAQIETLEVFPEHQETFLHWWSVSIAQVTQRGSGGLSPWRHWKSTWIWSWSARSRCPFLDTRGYTRWPQGFPSTLTNFMILWYQ